jgi:hypothetical protein
MPYFSWETTQRPPAHTPARQPTPPHSGQTTSLSAPGLRRTARAAPTPSALHRPPQSSTCVPEQIPPGGGSTKSRSAVRGCTGTESGRRKWRKRNFRFEGFEAGLGWLVAVELGLSFLELLGIG